MDPTVEQPADPQDQQPPVRELTRRQRRVLGVLVEKAITTPEYYPLTLKALTAGCNQKSNRDPVANYSEDQVLETMDELRQLGLAAVVHTESGRTERYRHYMRRRYPFSEPQLAIVTELLLRGRQAPGELRSRASRMHAIDSLDALRDALSGLVEQGYVRSSGPLDRRGVEIDHTFYPPSEAQTPFREHVDSAADEPSRPAATAAPRVEREPSSAPRSPAPDSAIEDLRRENRELRQEIDNVRDEVRRLSERFSDLERQLGG